MATLASTSTMQGIGFANSTQKFKGLKNFIEDIRGCETKELELTRVKKEMANIQSKFGNRNLPVYKLKKYVWKLLYMHMLGYDIDIGHMEAQKLVSGKTYSEKCCGYMALSILLNDQSDLLRLCVQSVKKDLEPVCEWAQCLALAMVGNVGGQEFADSIAIDVQQLLVSPRSNSFVRKKAALTLLRLFRKSQELITAEELAPLVIPILEQPHYGVCVSVSALLLGIVSYDATGWEGCVPAAVTLLSKLVFPPEKKSFYKYYHTICPWLQVKLLRLLQYFPPPEDTALLGRLNHVLGQILRTTVITPKYPNKNNGDHSILFEAINLIIHHCMHGATELRDRTVGILGRFISINEPNFRYLGLETMARLARVEGTTETIKKHHKTILFFLKDTDISIRKRALDLLYHMCDKENSRDVVGHLLKYLQHAAYDLREELVLKIAILSEKYAVNLKWYLDVVLQLISIAGDFVSEDIWHRVCQIVTNNAKLQDYAATTCYKFLSAMTVHENGIKVGAYILGEFSHLIKDKSVTAEKLFDVLRMKFAMANHDTKAIIFTAYAKLANTYDSLKEPVKAIFTAFLDCANADLQQRAVEYLKLLQLGEKDDELLENVFHVMPDFPERENMLLRRLKKAVNTADRDVWNSEQKKKPEEEEKSDDSSGDSDDSDSSSEEEESSGSEEDKKATSSSKKQHNFSAQKKELLLEVFGQTKGKVYESSVLQVGAFSMKVEGSTLKMALMYGNLSKLPIEGITCQVARNEALKTKVTPAEPFDIPPSKQLKHLLAWRMEKPISKPPMVKLNFTYDGKSRSVILAMPILATTFMTEASTLTNESFPDRWKAMEKTEVKLACRLPELMSTEDIKKRVQEGGCLRLFDEIVKKPTNFFAAGVMHIENQKAPCMLYAQTNPTMPTIRLTVRCQFKTVSEALMGSMLEILNCQPA